MDYQTYQQKYFTHPQPEPRFDYIGFSQVALFLEDYPAALEYYTAVLGPAAYVEGEFTHGWRLGSGWLTLFPAKFGAPRNVEITLRMSTPDQAEALQRSFIDAGGEGEPSSNQLMYEPVRYCRVRDPFGTEFLFISPLSPQDSSG